MANDLISRQAAIDKLKECRKIYCDNTPESFSLLGHSDKSRVDEIDNAIAILVNLPSAQPEDYTELKREFIRMASYIDVLLECSDEQKETLIGFISRLAEFMPWTERD